MKFILPELPYKYEELEPYIDKETMVLHHTKHHQAYVDKLNRSLEDTAFNFKTVKEVLENLDKLPDSIRQTVINNAGGHANHSFFWKIMSPLKTQPEGEFKKMLDDKFGGLDKFKELFSQKALDVFGSGWAFLILTEKGKVDLKRHSFQNSPLMHKTIPILGLDLWEHAYYLKYQNRRNEYIDAWWNVVNWKEVARIFNDSI